MSFESDEYLEHYGVKGMKWGHRKSADQSDAPRVSRRQEKKTVKAQVRAAKEKFYNDKADAMVKAAMKDPESLIQLRPAGQQYPTVVTGKQFMNFLSNGGTFDVKMSDVYATKQRLGTETTYVMNGNINARFDPKKVTK